jgi:hypothetical protein
MAAKLTRLTHKIAIQLRLLAESCTVAPGGQSGNVWIHPRTYQNSYRILVKAALKYISETWICRWQNGAENFGNLRTSSGPEKIN